MSHSTKVLYNNRRITRKHHRQVNSLSPLLLLVLALFSLFSLAFGNQALAAATPDDLEPWKGWVLERHPEANCPFLFNKEFSIAR